MDITFVIPTMGSDSLLKIISDIKKIKSKSEIIIIDDSGKNLNAKCILDEINEIQIHNKISIQYIKNASNFGPGKSRNIGIEKAQGKYISFVDDDDRLSKETLSTIDINKWNNCDVILTQFHDDTGVFSNHRILSNLELVKNLSSDNIINYFLKLNFYPSQVQPYFFRKDFLIRNNISFPNTWMGEDLAFNTCVFQIAKKFFIFNKPYYFYSTRENSLKSSRGAERALDLIEDSIFIENLISNRSKNNSSEITKIFTSEVKSFLFFLIIIRVIGGYKETENNLWNKNIINLINLRCLKYGSSVNINSMLEAFFELFSKSVRILSFADIYNAIESKFFKQINPYLQNIDNIFIYCYGPFGRSIHKLFSKNIKIDLFYIDDSNRFTHKQRKEEGILKLSDLGNLHKKKSLILVCNPQKRVELSILNNITQYIKLNNLTGLVTLGMIKYIDALLID